MVLPVRGCRSLLAWVLALVPAMPAVAQFGPQAILLPTRDATLYESATGALANGAGQQLFAGVNSSPALKRRALLHFDIAGTVPAGARITSVTLKLYSNRANQPVSLGLQLHRVTASWTEGASVASGSEGGGAPAAAGDATWLHRSWPSLTWATPGGDFVAAPSATASCPQIGSVWLVGSSPLLADVQDMLDNPASNHGWMVRSDELVAGETRRFGSRENLSPAEQPQLSISWLQPGQVWGFGPACPFGPGITSTPPVAGTNWTIGLAIGTSYAPAALAIGLGPGVPGTELLPACTPVLDPALPTATLWVGLLDVQGAVQQTYLLPPLLSGVLFTLQGCSLDPFQPAFVRLSPGLRALVQ